ncbi:MAG: IS200/IS605 family transposase [Chloroflexi bacterium]|nr:IS200/IS605 family transposase [Chloroflexota bacterium]
MAYWRLFYHITFATKNRGAMITPDIEPELHGYIVGKAQALGAIVYAVNGIAEHVHVATSVPPKVSIADFVGQIKGAASHHINHLPKPPERLFDWQRGYSVVSFGQKDLGRVIEYVCNQKEHHKRGTIIQAMEHADELDDAPQITASE